jgi:hypothetical protein
MALIDPAASTQFFFGKSLIKAIDENLNIIASSMLDDYLAHLRQGSPFRLAVNFKEIMNLPKASEINFQASCDNIYIQYNAVTKPVLEDYITTTLRIRWISCFIQYWQAPEIASKKLRAEQRIKESIELEQQSVNPLTNATLVQQQQSDNRLLNNIELTSLYEEELRRIADQYNQLRRNLLHLIHSANPIQPQSDNVSALRVN